MKDFYLRALRICSPQYPNEEFEYIKHSLKSLKYPKIFILTVRKHALNIHSSKKKKPKEKKNPTIPITHRPISVPSSTHNIALFDKLIKLGTPIIQTTPQTIKNLTNITKGTNKKTTTHAGIYSILCKDCNKHYIGEIQSNLEKCIYEHKRSINTNNDRNAVFSHMLEFKRHIKFFSSHPNQTNTLQKIPKTTRICGHFQNKPYKITSRFLPNFTILSIRLLYKNKIKIE